MRRKNWRTIKGRACRIVLKKYGSVVEIVDAIPTKCRESSAFICGSRSCFEFLLEGGPAAPDPVRLADLRQSLGKKLDAVLDPCDTPGVMKKEHKELTPSAESPHVRTVAREIITRAEKTVGPTYWSRLVFAGRLVECRAILCVDMIKDRGADSVDGWWRYVAIAIQDILAE